MQLCQHQNKFFFIFRYILLSKLLIYLHQLYDFDTQLRFCRFLFYAYLCDFIHKYSTFDVFMRFIPLNIHFILHRTRLRALMRSHAIRTHTRIKIFNKSVPFRLLLLKWVMFACRQVIFLACAQSDIAPYTTGNLPYVIARSNIVATWQSSRRRISLVPAPFSTYHKLYFDKIFIFTLENGNLSLYYW